MSARRVAVIGGGLAGLAAAARLRQRGIEPVVFERADDVGGVVRTIRRDGWLIDTGAAMAAEPATIVREMLDAAGLAAGTVRASAAGATRYIVLDGAPVALPRTTAEFTSSSLLSIAGRLRLLKERLIPARHTLEEESVDSFARRRFGDEMAERMFDPLVASTCAGDPRKIVARFAFPALVGHERGTGSSLQGSARSRMEARRRAKGRPAGSWSCSAGMQELPRQLARSIGGVRTATAVECVAATVRGVDVTPAAGVAEHFDGVILAVPAPALAAITIDLPASHHLAAIVTLPYASIAAVSLGFRRDEVGHPLDGARLLIPTIERREVLSMVFPSSLFPERAPDDHVLVTAFVGGALRPELVDATDAELIALVQREAAELLGARGIPAMTHVARWHSALPQAVAGHGERIAAADAMEAASPGVVFTGSWRDGLSVGEVLLGGIGAADRLLMRSEWKVR